MTTQARTFAANAARARVSDYVGVIEAHNADSAQKYGDIIHGLGLECTLRRSDLKTILSELHALRRELDRAEARLTKARAQRTRAEVERDRLRDALHAIRFEGECGPEDALGALNSIDDILRKALA